MLQNRALKNPRWGPYKNRENFVIFHGQRSALRNDVIFGSGTLRIRTAVRFGAEVEKLLILNRESAGGAEVTQKAIAFFAKLFADCFKTCSEIVYFQSSLKTLK